MAEFWVFACPTTRADEEGRLEGRGSENIHLSEKGLREAERIAAFLSTRNIAAIWCSASAAAWEAGGMAQLEYRKVSKTNISLLGYKEFEEIDFGAANGLTEKEISEIYPKSMRAWKHGHIEDDIPLFIGGESPIRAASRLKSILNYGATCMSGSSHKIAAVISHRHIISLLLAFNRGTSLAQALRQPVPNGSLSVVVRDRNHGLYWTEKAGSVEHLTG